jgi:iron complex outermembrane recepter protein
MFSPCDITWQTRLTQEKIMYRYGILPLSLFALTPLAAAQQASQPEIQEIIVSADFRGSGIDQISASISVLDSLLIQQRNAQHLEDLLINAPNVNLSSGGSRARFIQIRGIGERGQFVEPLNPSVGVIIDGVDFSGIGNAGLLYDIEQVEVFLGPQGTRYGSNALAGLINLQSKQATSEFSAGMQLENANHDSRGVAGYISGPLGSENLRFRLSGQNIRSDGFNHNDFLDRPTSQRDETSLRAKLSWDLADDITLDLNATHLDIDNGYDAFSLDNVRNTLSDEPGFDRQRSDILGANLRIGRFEQFSLEAIIGYADASLAYGYDEDWVFRGFHPRGYNSTDQYFRDRRTQSGEIRMVSTPAGALFNGRTDWVSGIYSLRQDDSLTRVYTFAPNDFNSRYRMDRLAWFADTETQLNQQWSVEAGLRLERFSARYLDSNAVGFRPDENLVGGKLGLNYRLENGNRVYLTASRGYKTGGFNTDGTLDADLREFGAEQVWNYELGFKGRLFDSVTARAALFYMKRDDVQISSSIVRVRNDGSAEFISYTGNAASGNNYGAEITVDWQATEQWRLYGNVGLLETEYRQYINARGDNLDGRRQAHAPRRQYTVGVDYQILSNLRADINLQGRSDFYFSDGHDAMSPAYDLLNANLIYQWDKWRFTLWGRNLTDKDYFMRGFFFGNDPRDRYTPRAFTQLAEPRRYGLTVNLDF